MSLKNFLMPAVTEWWLSPGRLAALRARAERSRAKRGERHTLHYFHQTDDPYSALIAQCLPRLTQRYALDIVAHLVNPPADDAAPDRERLIAYSRKDAEWLAGRHGLTFTDLGRQPAQQDVDRVSAQLVGAIQRQRFLELAPALMATLWKPAHVGAEAAAYAAVTAEDLQAHLAESDALRQRWGHYNGGMLYYAGEWYWGIDRLHHLEARLQSLGAARAGVAGPLYAPDAANVWPQRQSGDVVDFFFSLRSPYSAIAAHRLFALTQGTNVQVRLRYVLPMVMRGLAVPKNKRMYISTDAAREARRLNVPFGRICDPVGRPTERGLSLIPLAESKGLGREYVLSFFQGVWAEGLDAGTDKGLRRIAERAGLVWADAQAAMQNDAWRQTAEANRREMLGLGLWGVPSFRMGNTAVWGQDRMARIFVQ